MSTTERDSARVGCGRLVRPQFFRAPRGYAASDGEYRSRFNFVWWFWLPRIHTQRPNSMNPRVLRIIWLRFAAGLEIYGPESRAFWPNTGYCDCPKCNAAPAKHPDYREHLNELLHEGNEESAAPLPMREDPRYRGTDFRSAIDVDRASQGGGK